MSRFRKSVSRGTALFLCRAMLCQTILGDIGMTVYAAGTNGQETEVVQIDDSSVVSADSIADETEDVIATEGCQSASHPCDA